jgi:hypothetical protein
VNIGHAPLAVYDGVKRGIYDRGTVRDLPTDKPLRMGAYGDPASVPIEAWDGVTTRKVWTGYTHQWKESFAAPFKALIMASCDSVAEAAEAASNGWRSFLVQSVGHQPPRALDTILCPSDSHGTQCIDCGLCKGAASPGAPSIYIPAHGSSKAFV